MQFRILGAIEAGGPSVMVDLGPPKQRALLAVLLLHCGEIVPTERLIELLWGDDAPRTAAHSIQIYVSELRRALQPLGRGRLIITRPPGYVLDAPPDLVDAHIFGRLVDEGLSRVTSGDTESAAEALRSALALWHGPALSDFVYEEFAQPYIRRLNDLRLDAIEGLAAAELGLGRTSEALSLVEVAVREDPLRERSRELLMLALYRAGRHAEALRNFQQLRELLDEELGLEPSPPLRRLQERILRHDPTLLPQTQVAVGEVRNPYKGLRPFGEGDTDDFHGRDALIDSLLALLAGGRRLVSLVGPSGAGKSSLVGAGLVPRLRAGAVPGSERWIVLSMVPALDPLAEAEAAIARAVGPVPYVGSARRKVRPLLRAIPRGRQVLLTVDQFEEVFAVEEPARQRFLRALVGAVADVSGPLTVVLTLRADYYDRPLLDRDFAAVFVPSVVNVLPMTAYELEAAIVKPAGQVGVTVETALLAELVADAVGRPSGLPLLQYALTELFDQRADVTLTSASYRAMGGLQGVLSRRAEELYEQLGEEEQRTAMQVFLRLIRLADGTGETRRRMPLGQLVDMEVEPITLSKVLNAFGRYRLLSFDREALTGEATVEVAHEALFREWSRLAGWIDRHRASLRRRDVLALAVEEWELAGRNPDYLLAGRRLEEFDAWRREGALQLTRREQAFLDAALEHSRMLRERELTAAREQRSLRRSVVGLTAALLRSGGPPAPRVAILHEGGHMFTHFTREAFAQAVRQLGLVGHDLFFTAGRSREAKVADLRRASEAGYGLIVTHDMLDEDVAAVAREFPDTRYISIWAFDDTPNVTGFGFQTHQVSYLAGAAAALNSETGMIGFIGGVDFSRIWHFQAGYEAGARALNPDIEVIVEYITEWPDWDGFRQPAQGRRIAEEMYGRGADVIMHAAAGSGVGLFEAAAAMSAASGRHLWAIGVDQDEYVTIARTLGVVDAEAWRKHILSSVVLRYDLATVQVIEEFAQGSWTPGMRTFDLESGFVEISYSGGFLDDVRPQLEDLKRQIINGQIDVNRWPADKEAMARKRGAPLRRVRDAARHVEQS